jgi:hypothetical protein
MKLFIRDSKLRIKCRVSIKFENQFALGIAMKIKLCVNPAKLVLHTHRRSRKCTRKKEKSKD